MQLDKQMLKAFETNFRIASRQAQITRNDGASSQTFNVKVATHRFNKAEAVIGEIPQTVSSLMILHRELMNLEFPLPLAETDQILDRGIKKTISRIETLDFGDTIFAYKIWVDS